MKIVNSAVTFTIAAFFLYLGSGAAFAGMYAYIPNTGSDSIAVVDFDTDEITAEIDVENGPKGVVVTPDGQYVFVANSISGTVSVIQTSHIATTQDEVIDTISIGGELGGIAIDKDAEYVYVVSTSNEQVVKLNISDPENISKTGTYSVGSSPQGVAVLNDGDRIFVTNADDDTVSVVDSDGVSEISVGDSPGGIVAARHNDYVYVANEGDGTISVIDGDELEVVKTITVGNGPYALALASWDSYLYAANRTDGTVSIINAVTFSVLEEGVAVGSSPSGLSVPLNGSDAYVIDSTDNTLSIVDLDGNVTIMDNAYLNTSNITDLNGPMGLGSFIGGDEIDAPTDLTVVSIGESTIRIKWLCDAWNVEGYKVEVKNYSSSNSEYKLHALVTDPTQNSNDYYFYTIQGLNDGVKYGIKIASYTEATDSDLTSAVTSTTDESDDDDDDDSSDNDCFIGSLFH
ncbi:40-residue YVTN family beta-propeller repeat protein [Desulfatibacillum aliphaticivorans]|uniref:40-residue YVTN family beta-propeller repeat protein n=1 Tax=Desulfatibacillum aliphaticivorans TaxID=218208 RepID=B8FEF2_DESAL|nr:beta-propeller fold lactonase family protein [Desulfatibacillum aliphaticivorans]ACL06933.1 40-residue YVTN family beta-propeller repeat protein [Desulfatibacillum aliphaticivorans]